MKIPQPDQEFPIINAHAHTFTKCHTPIYIAKRFIPWPFYWILEIGWVLRLLNKYLNRNKRDYTYTGKNKKWNGYLREKTYAENPVVKLFRIGIYGTVWFIFLYYLLDFTKPFLSESFVVDVIHTFRHRYIDSWMPNEFHSFFKFLILLAIPLWFKSVRNNLKSFLWGRLKKWIGKQELEFLLRYINIVRFANKKRQANIFNDLEQQYPPDTKFVVLPMDMEHMEAGPVPYSYDKQMQEVLRLKSNNQHTVYPFVFMDPRRMVQPADDDERKEEKGTKFFDYDASDPDKIVLKECLVKTYFDNGCMGIKIYPALGYYPFDKALLPLWLYCVQQDIPITTHCSVGPIFYRGDKKKAWDRHPIFKEAVDKDPLGNQIIENLRLGQIKNKAFQRNFTHPLNYICLLDEFWLQKVLDHYADASLNALFGYNGYALTRNLSKLKINLAHYGGAENWDQFLRQDRYPLANKIIIAPDTMLELRRRMSDVDTFYPLWSFVDWFSIITSMIEAFDNVYADISYTTHDVTYLNLLSEVMNRPKIEERVLYGTDFFVVSNQKADKQYWIDMKNILSGRKWYMLANRNPNRFLTSKVCPAL